MMPGRTVVTIGSFDGVHVGHRALVRAACRAARMHEHREGLTPGHTRVVVMAFDPHPASALRPGTQPARLTSWTSREALLREAGADDVVRLEPTPELLGLSAAEFVSRVVERWKPVAWVEGPDFRFGRGRGGDVAALRRLGREQHETAQFAVQVVDPVEVDLSDQSIVPASSTIARWLLAHGRTGDAARVLGRPYAIEGPVVRGDRRGRTLGFPTANVDPESMLPADGVYAAVATVISPTDSRRFTAAVSVGSKPQFKPGESQRTLEAHFLDATKDGDAIRGLPEYGWRVRLQFLRWLRDQQRFDGVDALLAQIARDCDRARDALSQSDTLDPALGLPADQETPA